jgi:hypothetical protein
MEAAARARGGGGGGENASQLASCTLKRPLQPATPASAALRAFAPPQPQPHFRLDASERSGGGLPARFLTQSYIPAGEVCAAVAPHAAASDGAPPQTQQAPLPQPQLPPWALAAAHPVLPPWHPLCAPSVAWPAAPLPPPPPSPPPSPPPPSPAAQREDAAAAAAEAMLTLLAGASASSGPGPCCACGTRESPMWRKHPTHRRPLCNACGLRIMRGKPPLPPGTTPAPRRAPAAQQQQPAAAVRLSAGTEDAAEDGGGGGSSGGGGSGTRGRKRMATLNRRIHGNGSA